MENNEILNGQTNDNNSVTLNKNGNGGLIALLVIIIIVLAGYIVYTTFIQKPDSNEPKPITTPVIATPVPNNQEQENNSTITKLKQYDLTQEEQEFYINDKVVKIYASNNIVYVDGIKATEYGDRASVYVTNKYILIVNGAQMDTFPKAINENGQVIDVTGIEVTPSRFIEDLRIENGKVVASRLDETNIEAGPTTVEFDYEVNRITIKEV